MTMSDPADDTRLTPIAHRGRGREKGSRYVTEPRTTLSTWMEARHYDQIVQLANQQEKSVSAFVRDLIVLKLK